MTLAIHLSPRAARIIGCLIEKSITTPDQYPLSLHALTSACNQKSNRDPVLDLRENEVQDVLDELEQRHLVMSQSGFGSRVTKYQHRFCNSEFGNMKLTDREVAIVCELLLRGAQTPGELRSRASRLAPLRDVAEVERALEDLTARADGPFVAKLAREPGRREARYMHLFGGDLPPAATEDELRGTARAPSVPAPAARDRLEDLESEVQALRAEVAELRAAVERLTGVSS